MSHDPATQARPAMTRATSLGASEIAAVFGMDTDRTGRPYRTAYEVYLEKTGAAPAFHQDTPATTRGRRLEYGLLDAVEAEMGVKLYRGHVCRHLTAPLHATLDARTDETPRRPFTVEAKSSKWRSLWGEEFSDDVPEKVILQAHQQFACAGDAYTLCIVPVIISSAWDDEDAGDMLDVRFFHINRQPWLVDRIVEVGSEFMECVRRRTPPKVLPLLDTLAKIKRRPWATATLDEGLVQAWWAARNARLEAEKAEDDLKRQVIGAMGDAELGDFADVLGREVSYQGHDQEKVDVKVLRELYPDIAEQVTRSTTIRKLTLRKKKSKPEDKTNG